MKTIADDQKDVPAFITTLERKKASFDLTTVREDMKNATLVPVHSEDAEKGVTISSFLLDPDPKTQR